MQTRVSLGHAFHLRHHAARRLAFPDDFVFAEAALQVAILTFEAAELQRVLHGEQQFLGGDRLFQSTRRAARTAISMCAWPDIITTGVGTPCALSSSSSVRPSLPGMTTSESMRSKDCDFDSSRAFVGVVADGGFMRLPDETPATARQRVGLVVYD